MTAVCMMLVRNVARRLLTVHTQAFRLHFHGSHRTCSSPAPLLHEEFPREWKSQREQLDLHRFGGEYYEWISMIQKKFSEGTKNSAVDSVYLDGFVSSKNIHCGPFAVSSLGCQAQQAELSARLIEIGGMRDGKFPLITHSRAISTRFFSTQTDKITNVNGTGSITGPKQFSAQYASNLDLTIAENVLKSSDKSEPLSGIDGAQSKETTQNEDWEEEEIGEEDYQCSQCYWELVRQTKNCGADIKRWWNTKRTAPNPQKLTPATALEFAKARWVANDIRFSAEAAWLAAILALEQFCKSNEKEFGLVLVGHNDASELVKVLFDRAGQRDLLTYGCWETANSCHKYGFYRDTISLANMQNNIGAIEIFVNKVQKIDWSLLDESTKSDLRELAILLRNKNIERMKNREDRRKFEDMKHVFALYKDDTKRGWTELGKILGQEV